MIIHKLAFLIWMLGFPVAESVSYWLDIEAGRHKTQMDEDYAGCGILLIYLVVGWLLWRVG
ncbi:MAG: hypothetical protein KGL39_55565 [Patescibacteria group bacterium]|nr:hypothetical protein [Patescibacteria group bacterium]